MATVTRQNIGLQHDKISVLITTNDYLPNFDKALKDQSKNANMPGFRKGMVPAGLVKKMYGQNVFTDEVLRTVETELNQYMSKEAIDIFAQPLPLDNDARALDMNKPEDYVFSFEIGLKPSFELNLKGITVKRYVIDVTDKMIDEEVARLQTRFGKMTEPDIVSTEENVLNVTFTEADENQAVVENGVQKDKII